MRFFGSLIKYLIYITLFTVAAGAALFWFDTGSWLVKPLIERGGSFFLYPMRVRADSISGSLRNGYAVDGLRITSGDETLAVLRRASVSPDWDLVLSGMDGIPFIRSLNVSGLSTDLDSVMKIASVFPPSSEDKPEPVAQPFTLKLNPANISVSDVFFGSPYADLTLDSLTLDEAGKLLLDAAVSSQYGILPITANADIDLPSAEILSSLIKIGSKGTGKITGKIQPVDAKLFLTAIQLEDFVSLISPDMNAAGRIDAKLSAKDIDGAVSASGVLSMPRAEVMNIPLNFRLPFTWNGTNIFTVDSATFSTKAAALSLSVSGDIDRMRFTASGEGRNISLTEIGTMFAPEANIIGDGGNVKFYADTEVTDDVMTMIFQRTRAGLKASFPSVSAMGIKTAENLTADIKLTPGKMPYISLGGKMFGGKVFARGGAVTDSNGEIRPEGLVMSIVNLDVPSLVKAIPQISGAVENPVGKITARAEISDVMNVNARITSDRVGAFGVILTGLNAEAGYDIQNASAVIRDFTANVAKGRVNASGNADINAGTFTAHASAANIEPGVIPMLRGVYGAYSLKADASGNFTDIKSIIADVLLTARNAGYADIRRGNADIPIHMAGGVLRVSDASIRFPGSSANLMAEADIITGRFSANADADNLDLRFIPQLKQLKGTYSLRADAGGNFNDTRTITAGALLTAHNASYSGINIGDAEIPVTFRGNILTVANANATLPNGGAALNASVNLNDSTFRADTDIHGLELKSIPGLSDVAGIYSLKGEASGKFTDINAITANASLSARNAGYQGMNFGDAEIPVTFHGGVLNISGANASLPGGNLSAKGTVNLRNASNPLLDLTASTAGINIEQLLTALKLQDKSLPVSGTLKGSAGIRGNLSTAAMTANITAENVRAGDIAGVGSATLRAGANMDMSNISARVSASGIKAGEYADIPSVTVEADGNIKRVNIRKVDAKINGAVVTGSGSIAPDMSDIMASAVNIDTTVRNLDLKALLKKFMQKAPVEGVIDAKAGVIGTIGQPTAYLQLTKPVLYQKSEIHDITVSVNSPEPDHFVMTAKARINSFKPESDIDIRIKPDGIYYTVDTKPLDLDSAIETQMPDMAGMVRGSLVAHIHGSTKPGDPIVINASSNEIILMDKITVSDINLPVKYLIDKNRIQMTTGRAVLSGGIIRAGFEVDMKDGQTEWRGNVKATNVDFGKLTKPFMPEGELVGTASGQVTMKGTSTQYITLSFADGQFTTGPGCIQKVKLLESITPDGKITFEKVNGSFFWDGKDLFLNPGTGARAGFDEPLYRYFMINGSAGLSGKGLKLLCDGRFDLKLLDRLLGAMKGVFQYMTGSLARNVLRDAASRVIGVKQKDFQNVSFTIANSWSEPQLRDIKVTKPIEDFLPIDILNRDEEKQKDTTQFRMRFKLPVGEGAPSAEEESPGDQFKQQLIDNLFNLGL